MTARRSAVAPAVIAAVVTLVGLFAWDWWPADPDDPSFLEYRREVTSDGDPPGGITVSASFGWGWLVALVLALVAPAALAAGGRARWFAVLGILGGVSQLVAVRAATLIGTTVSPYLAAAAAVALAVALGLAHPGRAHGAVP